jgi:hypothetical protein
MLPLSTQEYLAQRLLNPGNLAIAASIGIHGLILGLALPSFSSWSKENQPPVTSPVNVVELTEAERARLPDSSPAATGAPDLGNLPLADTSALDAPPLTSSFPSSLDSLPAPPSLPSLPSLPPLSYNRIPVAIAPRALPPSIPFRTLPAPPPPYLPRFSQPFSNRGNQPTFDPPRGAINPDELINRKPNLDLPAGQSPVATATSGQAPTALPPGLEASLQRDDANTTDDEARRNIVDWMAKNRIGERPQALEIAGNYPPAACLKQLEGTAVYGVSVTPQGTLAPYLIKSSAYPILNQQAARDVGGSIPKQAGSYRVTVNYKYNPKICPVLPATTPQTTVPPKPVLPANPATPSAIRQVPETPQIRQPQPAATPTAPQSKPPQATPEARRNPPATPQPQPSVKPAVPEARRNPPETPAMPEARRNPPETPQPQPSAISGQSPTAAPSPALSPSPQPMPEAFKPATPLGVIAPRKK